MGEIKLNSTSLCCVMVSFMLSACNAGNSKESVEGKATPVVREVMKFLHETGIPSVSYVIIKDGKIVESDALGFSNIKKKTSVDRETYYNTGSNFKSVTSTAIMQLHDKGLLDIDRPINDFLKNPIKNVNPSNPITARHLMSHQAGIKGSVLIEKLWEYNQTPTFDEIIASITLFSEPGIEYEYANDGFVIAAKLIEDVTGMSYESYIWENILEPLGITTRGFVSPSPSVVENLALPYHIRYNQAFPTDQLQLPQYPCGSVYLTPTEMAKFLVMHLNEGVYENQRLLSSESVAAMHQQQIKVTENFHYGLGFGREQISDKTYSFHQGSLPGYLSAFRMDFDAKTAVYLATNVTATPLQEQQVGVLLDFLTDYASGKTLGAMTIPREKKDFTDRDTLLAMEQYTGTYQIEGTEATFIIELIGERLYLINPAGKRFELAGLDATHFFLTTENEDIIFTQKEGVVSGLTLLADERKVRAFRAE